MISCPKCHFQQPKDQYCAKCGVDMGNYKPPRPSLGQMVTTLFKPLLLFLGILLFFFLALKALNSFLNIDSEFSRDTQAPPLIIGIQAESIRKEASPESDSIPTETIPPPPQPTALASRQEVPRDPLQQKSETILPEQYISVSLVEVFIPGASRGDNKTLLTQDPQVLVSFFNDNGTLKDQPFISQYEDNMISYEISVQVLEHKDSKNKFVTKVKRRIKSSISEANSDLEATDTMSLEEFSILKDPLPRTYRIPLQSPLLNLLSQSPSFTNYESELAIVVHFEGLLSSD